MCARGIHFASVYDFSIGFWKCSDIVVFFVFHLITMQSSYKTDHHDITEIVLKVALKTLTAC